MIKYEHLLGLKFKFGEQDCYTLMQMFYRDNFGFEFPNYARPKDFWHHGLDLYGRLYYKNGFRDVDCHPSEYRPADLVLMAIQSSVPNHVGMIVENGVMLHHMWGSHSLSSTTPIRGLWRNNILAVLRHKDLNVVEEVSSTEQILDHVSPNTRRKISDALKHFEETGELPDR